MKVDGKTRNKDKFPATKAYFEMLASDKPIPSSYDGLIGVGKQYPIQLVEKSEKGHEHE